MPAPPARSDAAIGARVPGCVMHAVQQGSQQCSDVIGREPAIVGLRLAQQAHPVPLPIGRKNSRQSRHVGAIMAEAGRIGVGERLCNAQADMAGAPSVLKANVQQMGRKAELGRDPGEVEEIVPVDP